MDLWGTIERLQIMVKWAYFWESISIGHNNIGTQHLIGLFNYVRDQSYSPRLDGSNN